MQAALSDVMFGASIKADERLAAKLVPAGKIKLVIVSGIFVRQNDARLDLLVVGDDIHEDKLARDHKVYRNRYRQRFSLFELDHR